MPSLDGLIRLSNPWWDAPQRIDEDEHLQAFRKGPFHWDPPTFLELDLDVVGTHTLRGPRQVGKTTTIKRLVRRLIERGESRVLYFSFDLEREPGAIVDVVRRARDLHPEPEGKWYLFLDEVTQLQDWGRGVKYAWDQGLTRDDVLVLSGSSAADLLEGANLLPGRRGEGSDLIQMPVSFRSFARTVLGIEIESEPTSPMEMIQEKGRTSLKRVALRLEDLNRALRTYLSVGGMPAAIRDHMGARQVGEGTLNELWEAVVGDLVRRGMDRVATLKLLERVTLGLGSGFSWTSAGEAMGMAPNSAKRYVHFLALSFVLLPVYFWDLGGKGFNPSKERKMYFLDPVFSRLPTAGRVSVREPSMQGLVESAVASSLFRSLPFSLLATYPLPHALAYWKATSGREIDFLADPQGGLLPIEVKWSDSGKAISNARKAILRSFEGGAILTRSRFQPEAKAPAIPTSCFLYLLEDRARRMEGPFPAE